MTELQTKWIEALRSGKYKQGKGLLKRLSLADGEYRYCCLGVLCDIIDPNAWVGCYFNGSGDRLPDKIRETIGITHHFEHKLMCVNDNDRGKSFIYIANILEKQFSKQ